MTVRTLPRLSPSETEILRLLWQLGRGTVQDVCQQLPKSRPIAYATVQTMLRRLEAKGYVGHDTAGKAHVFHPTAQRRQVVGRAVRDFVGHLFGGDPVSLMLHLAEHTELTSDEVQRLKRLIDKKPGA